MTPFKTYILVTYLLSGMKCLSVDIMYHYFWQIRENKCQYSFTSENARLESTVDTTVDTTDDTKVYNVF